MKKLSTLKTMLAAALLAVGVSNVWADEQPTPVYFNDFSSTDGLTVVGNGIFEDDADVRFGKVFHNDPTLTKAIRTNWLELPADIFSHSTETKEMTIGFWVNKKTAVDYYFSPLFTAYGADNVNKSHSWSEDNANGWWPFFYLEARGIMQWNAGGWCDFTVAQNDNPVKNDKNEDVNFESTVWTDDGNWHYVTMTFTTSTAKVFVDGNVHNSWTIADNGLAGLFTQTDLKHFCLGGNQAFGWEDPDPAFAFDDFAVYDKALTVDQIKAVIAKKMVYAYDFQNNNGGWTVYDGTNFDYKITPMAMGDVTLTAAQGAALQPVRYFDNGIDKVLQVRDGAMLNFKASDGKSIRKITATPKNGTFAFTANIGTVAEQVWTGNVTEVTLTNNTGFTTSFYQIYVETADADANTETPQAETVVEANSIAEFNALEDGKLVKLTLTNARVNAFDTWSKTAYIEDEAGNTTTIVGQEIAVGKMLNGYVEGEKGSTQLDYANPEFGSETKISVTSIENLSLTDGELTGTEMTPSAIIAITNSSIHGRLLKITNVGLTKVGSGYYVYVGEDRIRIRDIFSVLASDFEWPAKASSITGLCTFNGANWQLAPVKADAIVAAGTQKVAEFDFLNNNMDLVIGSTSDANGGNLGGKSVKKDDVTISFVNSSTMPTRYYFNAGKNQLQVIAGGQIRFSAAEGQAITKIEITPVAASNNKWNVDDEIGTLSEDKLTWAGNTTTVRFTATGALYLTNIVVTTAAKNDATITPADNETYTEVSSLAEFNALEKGTLAKLNLTNAVITSGMVNDWGYYVQDATAGAHFYCTGLNFEVNDAINGYVYVKKDFTQPGPRIAMTEKTNADNLEVTHNATYSPVEGTLAEVAVAPNNNMVIKLTGVAVKGTAETEATITSGESSLPISNGKTNYAPYVYKENLSEVDYSSATVVGILWSNAAANTFKLYPLSITEDNGSGIETIHNSQFTVKNSIYNLQGIRLNSLQKGLNIVNGKKVVIR